MDFSSSIRMATLPKKRSSLVPPSRNNQVCYFNLTDSAYPVGFNVLEDPGARSSRRRRRRHRRRHARHLDRHVGPPARTNPSPLGRGAHRDAERIACACCRGFSPMRIFAPASLSRITNPLTRAFFEQRFNSWRDDYREQAIDPVLNKIDAFLFSPAILNVIGQAKSTLHFEQAMAKRRVVIANLARGIIGETPSNLMGALLLARVQAAGMARASLPQEARTPFHIVIDEVQLFGTEVIAQILSEARKYGLSLTMATQFMAGLSEKTRAAVMGNVAALIVFRVGHEDAIVLAPEFDRPHQAFNPYALRQLPRGEAMVRVSSHEGELVEMHPDPASCGSAERVKQQSRIHYGVRREEVEQRLTRLLRGAS